jgi:hypothetical protein
MAIAKAVLSIFGLLLFAPCDDNGPFPAAGRPEARFAGRGPYREVGHSRQPSEVDGTHSL